MTQPPERPAVQDLLGAAPRRQLGKIEIDDGRLPASARRLDHAPCRREIGPQRLFDEDGLSEVERMARHLGLEIGRHRDGNGGDGAILDQRAPIAEPTRNLPPPTPRPPPAARASSAVRAPSLPASATTSQRGSVRNAGSSTVRP